MHKAYEAFTHSVKTLVDSHSRAGEYAERRTRTVWSNLNPVWNQLLELPVHGGLVDNNGVYVNKSAPFTKLRVQVCMRVYVCVCVCVYVCV